LSAKTLWLASKWDLISADSENEKSERDGCTPELGIPVSTLEPKGLEALQDAILQRFELPTGDLERPLVTNARHLAALERAMQALTRAQQSLEHQAGYEFTAFDLAAAAGDIGEILGISADGDLLNDIFANFCIGK